MNKKILHVGSPNIGNRRKFHKYVDEIFNRRWLTNRGGLVLELERKLAEFLGVEHCIAMCNGTIALEIAIRALELSGEVIVPSMTFIATAHALQWQEIKPVFCDIDRQTYTLDPVQIERHITPNTSAIIGVHTFSRPCDIDGLQEVADKNGLKLLFDAAHAFGCSYKGQTIGRFGNCEVLSFHATKFFNTFEGGAIATNDDALAEKIRLMQNFGFAGEDSVIYIGTNGKMNEVSAAMGLVNLDSIDEFLATNKRNYKTYKTGIQQIDGLTLAEYDHSEKCNYQYIVLEVGDDYPLNRDELVDKLRSMNVLARRYFWPGCHKMEPYKSLQPNANLLLPITEDVANRIVVMPNGTQIDGQMIRTLLETLR
nr:DegT/DnrJ/EryC1/StrS family aminotransferase [uncultured Desulfobacter sp.]